MNKLRLMIALTAAVVLMQGQAFAKTHEFEVGPEISYINYEEPDVMEQEGAMYGFFGKYTLNVPPKLMLRLDGTFKWGQVDYTSNGTGTLDNIDDFMVEVRGTAGKHFDLRDNLRVTPYSGIGYRYLNDDSGGRTTTTGHSGYERESNYLYLPLGVETYTPFSDGWSLGVNFEFDVFLYGLQISHLEDVSPSITNLENDQNTGYGLRGSIKIRKKGEKFDITVEPFVRWWDIDDSNSSLVLCGGTPCALGYEPKNQSLDVGARVGLNF